MKDEVRVIMSCTVLSRQRFSLIVTVWLPLCWVYRQDLNCMLIFRKSWAAAKESASARECCCTVELPHSLYGCAAVCLCACVSVQVKDVMYHLYMQALGNMRMLVPKEVRILRHVLSLEDPREMMGALTAAFSPGTELEVQNAADDYLYT